MKFFVHELILEVTRKCNMCCPHCLRGDAENMDMKKETIDKILDSIEGISNVTFTGGEPTLNLPLIEYFFQKAEEKEKMPSSFFIATNGKENQLELASILLKWYEKMDEKECCAISISKDAYHEDISSEILKGLVFYSDCKEHSDYELDEDWIINEGRAYDNGFIGSNRKPNILNLNDQDIDSDTCYLELLYVAADEKILGDCDVAFENQEEYMFSMLDDFQIKAENEIKKLEEVA